MNIKEIPIFKNKEELITGVSMWGYSMLQKFHDTQGQFRNTALELSVNPRNIELWRQVLFQRRLLNNMVKSVNVITHFLVLLKNDDDSSIED